MLIFQKSHIRAFGAVHFVCFVLLRSLSGRSAPEMNDRVNHAVHPFGILRAPPIDANVGTRQWTAYTLAAAIAIGLLGVARRMRRSFNMTLGIKCVCLRRPGTLTFAAGLRLKHFTR